MEQPLPLEPLTRREREILTLLALNLSDREIADRLFVAPTTVKWFNRQIFRKLAVETRTQAVQRAETLGLLEAVSSFVHNLPAQLTSFIGRAEELSEIRRWLLHPQTRLITILAPGGMGKTRLAVEAAVGVLDAYADGVCFVPLAGLTSSDPLIATLIDTLGLQFAPDGRPPKQQLFEALRRKQLLLVLDNFEHLLDNTAVVAELLVAAPQVTVLATSRERLNILGELVYPLMGLTVGEGRPDDAVQLFIASARRVNLHFEPDDTGSITRLCHLVQGMPLAIELAAAWSATLSPAEIAAEVERSVDFLQTTMPNVPERLRSVRAVFQASWGRLNLDARQVFRRLSVFRGGCTREAAEVVTGATVAMLGLLVDQALLWRNPRSQRYEIHELLRQYAEQELLAAGEAEPTRQAHHQYYAQIARTWGSALLADGQREGLRVIDADEENIREALTYATRLATPETIEPFTDLWTYYDLRSRWADGDQLFRAACDALEPDDSLALAKLLVGRAVFYERLRLWEPEFDVATRGYAMIRRLGEVARRDLPLAMITYADGLRDIGRWEEAVPIYHEALPIAHSADFPMMVGTLLFHLGNDDAINGRWEAAKANVTESYRIAARLNNIWGMCFCLEFLGIIALQNGELGYAAQLFKEILDRARPSKFDFAVDRALTGLGSVARERGDWQTTYRLNEEVLRTRLDVAPGDQIFMVLVNLAEAALMLNRIKEAREHMGEAAALLREWTVAEQVVRTIMPETFVRLLIRAVELQIYMGDFSQAVVMLSHAEIYLPICDYDAPSMKRISNLMPQLIDRCRSMLDPQVFQAAALRGNALSFEDAVAELFAIR